MRKRAKRLCVLFVVCMLASSCGLQKRVYKPGWFVPALGIVKSEKQEARKEKLVLDASHANIEETEEASIQSEVNLPRFKPNLSHKYGGRIIEDALILNTGGTSSLSLKSNDFRPIETIDKSLELKQRSILPKEAKWRHFWSALAIILAFLFVFTFLIAQGFLVFYLFSTLPVAWALAISFVDVLVAAALVWFLFFSFANISF